MGTHLVDGLETFHELKRLISSITETIHKRERENRKCHDDFLVNSLRIIPR